LTRSSDAGASSPVQRYLLDLELLRWRTAGRQAVLWWRDDDARAETAPLRRMLDLADRHAAPFALAVIPDQDLRSLAACLAVGTQATPVQHGVDHQNRREGAEAGEFPHHWLRLRVVTLMRQGWSRMQALPAVLPLFVPPWNDIHPELPGAIADCGYVAWSAWSTLPRAEGARPHRIDAHIDLLRWRGGARFRGASKFYVALREALETRRKAERWDAPIGLLTHHLDHDAAAWAFLDDFLAWTRAHPEITWRGPRELAAVPAQVAVG
jgi:hypothetical protein